MKSIVNSLMNDMLENISVNNLSKRNLKSCHSAILIPKSINKKACLIWK